MGLGVSKRDLKGYGEDVPRDAMPMWLQKKARDECSKPLNLAMPVHYGARHGNEEGMGIRRRVPEKSHLFFEKWRINGPILMKAIICLLGPPIIFFWTTTFLSFYTHYANPQRVWPIAFLAVIPVLFTAWATFRNWKMGLDVRWAAASTILFFIAFVLGMLLGDMNYLANMHHFYFISSLKSYSNIKPADVTGTQLMDAGRVQFGEGTKLLIDMGMSFTMGETFCVAPIGPPDAGSEAPQLASYDLWAVGKNCCRSDNPTFACGEYQNINAKSGLRQTDEGERLYYNLAVQQAEAAYGINAQHPIFFHWVEDADATMQKYFSKGFRAWVFMIFCHMVTNAFVVVMLINVFKYSHRSFFAEPPVPGAYMIDGHMPSPEH